MKTFKLFAIIIACAASLAANAQIGYQVSLLNSATGEPRANETVSVTIDITNSENTSIYQGTQTATTNDFGVLSLLVGNATTFENVDWSKLPLFVSATVDGVMVGRSQILNVPVAEAAKTLVSISPDVLCTTWVHSTESSTTQLTFHRDGTWSSNRVTTMSNSTESGFYVVYGSIIYLMRQITGPFLKIMFFYNGKLYHEDHIYE